MKDEAKSIYDIARMTGVSYATVSRVLNGNGRTSPETRRSVLKTAAKYNFRPKMKARKTTVAIMIDVYDSTRQRYIPSILSSLVEKLSCHDVAIEIFTRTNINQFKECFADAVIAMPWHDSVRDLLCGLKHVPRLTINYSAQDGCSNVASNHEQSGRMAAEHLLSRGHKRSGIIVSTQDWGNSRRIEGFRKFFDENGIEVESQLCGVMSNNSPSSIISQMLSRKATAIFIGMEDASIEICSILSMLNVKVPEDLSLISMENSIYSRFLHPPMTTINQQLETMVERAVELIIEKVYSKDISPEEILIDNQLIERQSVRNLSSNS